MPRHIVVTGNVPNSGPHKRYAHTRFSVVCSSVKRAIELAEEAHPGFVTMGVADQGAVDKVDL